jgi:hypothetical protein
MKLRLTCTGTRPLLMHNVQLASPLNPYAKRLKALNAKRVKTDEDRLEIARVEFEGGLYWAEGVGPYLSAAMLRRSLVGGARLIRAGKTIERGVVITDYLVPLLYDGPRDIEGLWGGGPGSPFVDIRPATVARQKIDRCRPIFRTWLLEADLVADPQVIEYGALCEVARLAGEMEGIGDFREMYGRYTTRVERL